MAQLQTMAPRELSDAVQYAAHIHAHRQTRGLLLFAGVMLLVVIAFFATLIARRKHYGLELAEATVPHVRSHDGRITVLMDPKHDTAHASITPHGASPPYALGQRADWTPGSDQKAVWSHGHGSFPAAPGRYAVHIAETDEAGIVQGVHTTGINVAPSYLGTWEDASGAVRVAVTPYDITACFGGADKKHKSVPRDEGAECAVARYLGATYSLCGSTWTAPSGPVSLTRSTKPAPADMCA